MKTIVILSFTLITIPLVGTSRAGDEQCNSWQSNIAYPTIQVRFCHEVQSDGTLFWFTIQYRNQSSKSVSAHGEIEWADGSTEAFWATLGPNDHGGTLCSSCQNRHPQLPHLWRITKLD